MAQYIFVEVDAGIPPREKLITPVTIHDIVYGEGGTSAFDPSVRAFARDNLLNPGLCTITWRERGKPNRPMLVRRAGGEPTEEFGLIHISAEETPLDILDLTTRKIVARIISRPTVDSTATPLESL